MKFWINYKKEMKIAARGFYFYIEIFVAVIILIILLAAVSENPESKTKEFLYYEMPDEVYELYWKSSIESGRIKTAEPTTFEAKAVSFELENLETGEIKSYDFDKQTYEFATFHAYDKNGIFNKYLYIADTKEALFHMAYMDGSIGAVTRLTDDNKFTYDYVIQGYETERLKDLLYILHNENTTVLEDTMESFHVRTLNKTELLNNREALVPVMVVFMGSLMGFFIVMAYIFLDKDEGVIRAFAVSPSSVWTYLLTKTMVIMTTVIISSTIITVPVMGLKPNYLLFYLFLLISTFAFASLGLLISSFYDNISKSFGALYFIMIALMIPAFSYYIPGFDPLWLRFFPTYPLLQGFKEIMLTNCDVGYVLTYCGIFLVGGILLFVAANTRFKKTLTV